MSYFDKDDIKKELNSVKKITIDSICNGLYEIYYEFNIMEPEKNKFVFEGILPGKIFSDTCKFNTIEEVFEFIDKNFPTMNSDKWKKLEELREATINTGSIVYIESNHKTNKAYDDAVEKLVDFEKENKLYYKPNPERYL